VQGPGLCLLTDGLLFIEPSKGFSVRAVPLQIAVSLGSAVGQSLLGPRSQRPARAWLPKKPGQPQLLVKRCETAVSQAALVCPVSLLPDAFGYSLVFFCKAQIRFLLESGW